MATVESSTFLNLSFTENPFEVRPCTWHEAKHAVMNWHYSKSMPSGNLIKFGVWENGNFIGAILYGPGANHRLGNPYGLNKNQIHELVRIALTDHTTPVSQLVAETLRQIKQTKPEFRLIVSFADPTRNHHGGIYQASNWIYTGQSSSINSPMFVINGKTMHGRSVSSVYGRKKLSWLQENIDPDVYKIYLPGKHRYLYPLDKAMRRQIQSFAQPYPRGSGFNGETADFQSARPGSIPGNRSNS